MASLCILNSRGLVACKSKAALSTWGFSPLQPQANWNEVIMNKSRGEIHISTRATHNSMSVFTQIWTKKVHLKTKSDSSLTFMLINFLVQMLKCTESLIFIHLVHQVTYIQWLWTEHGKLALAEVKQPTSSNMYDLPYFIIGNIKKTLNLVVPSWVRAQSSTVYSLSSSAQSGPWGYLRP